MKFRYVGGSALRMFMGMFVATTAMAQEEPFVLDTIFVDARLFEEPTENVPGSATLKFPSELGPQKTVDLGKVTEDVPNVTFQKTNADERLIIRGISAYPNALADPVGVLVNGVALPLGTVQAPTPIALDRATILVGPQGAHYGRNSEAGLVSLEFAAPGGEDVVRGRLTAAEDNTFAETVYLNRRIGNLGLVFALDGEQSDGQISNPITGSSDGGERDRLTGYAGVSFVTDGGTTIELTHVGESEEFGKEQFRYSDGLFATDRFESAYSDPSSETRDIRVTSLRIRHSFEWGEFTAITGATGFDREFTLDFDTAPINLGVTEFDLEDRLISQEFRFASPPDSDGPWKWSAGISAYTQDTDTIFDLSAVAAVGATLRDTEITQDGVALFGFAEYAVTDRLRLGMGARLDRVSSSATQVFTSALGSSTYSADQSDTEFLPKITAAYDLNGRTLIYGSVSRGYLAGGYNYNFANSAETFTFEPEFTTTAELGLRYISGRTSVDLAAFYSDVTDKQIVEVVPGGAQRVDNAASVEAYGVEGRVEYLLDDTWTLSGSLGLLNATARSFDTAVFGPTGPVLVDYSDNELPFAPDATYALGVGYDQGSWFGNLALNGFSAFFFDVANTLEQSAFATVDASVGWRKGRFEVALWATNLFDEEFLATALSTPRGTLVEDGQGRRVGLTVSAEW